MKFETTERLGNIRDLNYLKENTLAQSQRGRSQGKQGRLLNWYYSSPKVEDVTNWNSRIAIKIEDAETKPMDAFVSSRGTGTGWITSPGDGMLADTLAS